MTGKRAVISWMDTPLSDFLRSRRLKGRRFTQSPLDVRCHVQ